MRLDISSSSQVMAEIRESSNQAIACRLCLSDKFDSLKPIFSNELGPNSIPQKIQQLLLIQVQKEDQLSTLICNDCIIRLDTWQSYKKQCRRNQIKLMEILNRKKEHRTAPGLEANLFIKSEPDDLDSNNADENVEIVNETPLLSIKVEVAENTTQDEDHGDLPPSLTPHAYDSNENNFNESTANLKETIESRTCKECDRTFCSIYSMKRHRKVVHKKSRSNSSKKRKAASINKANIEQYFSSKSKITLHSGNEGSKSQGSSAITEYNNDSKASQSSVDKNAPDNSLSSEIIHDAENESMVNLTPLQEKIQFAAGLKLVQKSSLGTILSKVELSYMNKCRAMVSMFNTHKCACHNVQYNSLRNLLSHLKEVKSWFPLFTCYSCMISFTDRSSFSVHYSKCSRGSLETLRKLSSLKSRSENKIRLYQNYKCNLCKFIYSFYDDFRTHVTEEHVTGEAPFTCSCQLQFNTAEGYKTHCLNSCFLSYYCDICYATSSTADDFLKHCLENHDSSDGFALLQKSNNIARKSSQSRETVDIANLVHGKRDRQKSVKISTESEVLEKSKYISSTYVRKILNIDNPRTTLDWKKPACCPYCRKSYSSAHNMARHYKSHLEKNEVPMKSVESTDHPESFHSCPDCPGIFTSSDWKTHLEQSHPLKSCTDCTKTFKFQSELDEHKKTHLSVTLYRNSKTNSYTVTPTSSTEAMQNKKLIGEVMVLCETCDIMFTNKEDLNKHKTLCHETPNLCSSVDTLETSLEDIDLPILEPEIETDTIKEKPKKVFSNSQSTVCEICNRYYLSMKSLRAHIKAKHGPGNKNAYPKKCDYCDKIFTTGASFYNHTQKHERLADFKRSNVELANIEESDHDEIDVEQDESYHTCDWCFKVFDSKFKLKEHMRSHGGTKSPSKRARKVLCDLCHISVNDQDALRQHKIEEHRLDSRTVPMPVNNSDVYSCDICDKKYNSRRGYNRHKKSHISTKSKSTSVYCKCKYCKVVYNSVDNLTKHMNREHSEIMKSVSNKNINIKKKGPERLYKCPLCSKMFKTLTAMSSHSGWHKRSGFTQLAPTANTPQATATAKLIKHTRILSKGASTAENKTELKDYQCKICSMQLSNGTALQIHMLQVHQNVDAKMLVPRCSICNEDFETQAAYEIHKRYHYLLERRKEYPVIQNIQSLGQDKQHSCGFCNATFDRSEILKAHIRLYHDFKCKFCPRVFAKQKSLSAHLKVHEKQNTSDKIELNNIKSYACSICKASFNYASDLREHTIKEHPF